MYKLHLHLAKIQSQCVSDHLQMCSAWIHTMQVIIIWVWINIKRKTKIPSKREDRHHSVLKFFFLFYYTTIICRVLTVQEQIVVLTTNPTAKVSLNKVEVTSACEIFSRWVIPPSVCHRKPRLNLPSLCSVLQMLCNFSACLPFSLPLSYITHTPSISALIHAINTYGSVCVYVCVRISVCPTVGSLRRIWSECEHVSFIYLWFLSSPSVSFSSHSNSYVHEYPPIDIRIESWRK